MTDIELIAELQRAADSLNLELFDGQLAALPITLHDDREEYGLYYPNRCISVHRHIAEHASAQMVARTLAHEMCHQASYQPDAPWHGPAWAQEMQRLGLGPDTSIVEGGKFAEWMARREAPSR